MCNVGGLLCAGGVLSQVDSHWRSGEAGAACKPLEGAPSSQLQLLDIDSTRAVAVRTLEGIAVLGIGSEGIQTVSHVPGEWQSLHLQFSSKNADCNKACCMPPTWVAKLRPSIQHQECRLQQSLLCATLHTGEQS